MKPLRIRLRFQRPPSARSDTCLAEANARNGPAASRWLGAG